MSRALACAVVLSALLSSARADAETVHTCTGTIPALPATITSQGVWCLDRDIATAQTSGAAIAIGTNNVTIACNDFKIGNLAAGASTATTGIDAAGRSNITVHGCNLRGFGTAIRLEGGLGGHVIEGNRIEGARMTAIRVTGGASAIRHNRILDTGGSSVQTGSATAVSFEGSVEVIDNVIDGFVVPTGAPAFAPTGIKGIDEGQSRISRNILRHMAVADPLDTAMGIDVAGYGTVVDDNLVGGAGSDIGIGIRCLSNLETFVHGNIVSGFAEAVDFNCIAEDNHIIP